MKKKKLLCLFCVFVVVMFLIISFWFVNFPSADTQSLTLVSYNAQTFFDSVEDGREFAEFKGSKTRWSAQKYRTRLKRLKEILYTMGKRLGERQTLPDIVVLQEIENERVLEDFCKILSVHDSYPYVFCTPVNENAPFSTAVLSKYPIEDFRIFTLQTVQDSYAARLRPLTEISINVGNQDEKRLIKLFSVHWKSKRGKNSGTAIRILQEKQLIQKIVDTVDNTSVPFIACGDFNQSYESFTDMKRFSVCWNVPSYCNAQMTGTQPAGSYYFRNNWEKIDHIFYIDSSTSFSNGINVQKFFVMNDEPFVEDGMPARYDVRTGQGYSDHLPIGIRFVVP